MDTKKEDKLTLEDINRLGLLHYKSGNRISYPQLEEWSIYRGEKYSIKVFAVAQADFHNGAYLSNAKGKIDIIAWTPHKDVAEQIVTQLKKCGWKYKDTSVDVLTSALLKKLNSNPRARLVKANTFAGFTAWTIMRNDEEIIVIPNSDVIVEYESRK
jgi:hypothetical protein